MFTQEQNKSGRNKSGRNKLLVIAAGALMTLMLSSTAVRAHHDHAVIAPLVAGFALGALVNYGHSSHHYYRYQYQKHGHYHRRSGHQSGHGYRSQNSNGSYRKRYYSEGYGSHDRYSQKRRHSSNREGHYTPRRKH